MYGSYPQSEKHGSIAAAYYFRQFEIRRTYARNFYRGMLLALGVNGLFVVFLILLQPTYQKPAETQQELLPPTGIHFNVMHLTMLGSTRSGMDFAGAGGGNGNMSVKPNAAFGTVVRSAHNRVATITPQASIVPRSLQGPGMNDIIGINKGPAPFDTSIAYAGTSRNGQGSGGDSGSTIGNSMGAGSGLTDTAGFGGGFGNKFVPGNPSNNSATGTPYEISWNGLPRTLVRGNRPEFPSGAQNGGTVRVRIVVDPRGNVVAMIPVEKTDYKLEQAAMDAIRTWRFSRLPQKYPQVNQQAIARFIFKAE